ncbi:hypothetical protein NE237_011204 [Protea cynaroides]|uniref:Uncharacterized protein n=1 Tax=Protea cynaroides TaxID=273540 RepID=A0A9Q0JWJ9_9MAGN|nr:hypothetical protein NE237_011204 [Protea cynaroides]
MADNDTMTAYEILQQYDLPVGIVPKSIVGYQLDRSMGKFTGYLYGSCSFSLIGSYQLKYQPTLTGSLSKDKLTQLQASVSGCDELQFSVGIASTSFPIENFLESPQCGCGFECDDKLSKGIEALRFIPAKKIRNLTERGTPKGRALRPPPQLSHCGRPLRMNSESQFLMVMSLSRRRTCVHAADSELA